MCPAGSRVKTDCSEFRLTSCLPCIDGTFMNRFTGLKECLPCISCDEGWSLKVKTSCTTTSDAVCEPLDGFYCIDPIGNNCVAARKHRICHPGQYINQTGRYFCQTSLSYEIISDLTNISFCLVCSLLTTLGLSMKLNHDIIFSQFCLKRKMKKNHQNQYHQVGGD
uniref:TNFR-Cys domain-containing protein n=1 Tax=Amphiprion ocellaris TaxID=80972 RepID=A0AAQ6ACV2_AMPOC